MVLLIDFWGYIWRLPLEILTYKIKIQIKSEDVFIKKLLKVIYLV
jgi:hypothetical protein